PPSPTPLPYTTLFRSVELAPADERFLAAVGDPDLLRPQLADGGGELVPVGMVREDQRQLDVGLLGTLADAHPAAGEGGDRVGETDRKSTRLNSSNRTT